MRRLALVYRVPHHVLPAGHGREQALESRELNGMGSAVLPRK
jgi:hypothetical protein